MSDAKHTPAPWRVEGHRSGVPHGHIISHGINSHGDGPEGYVCDTWNSSDADARLIAAAPDLLEALKWIAHHYANQDMNHRDFRVEAAQRAEAAIAKAEGKL